MLEIHDGLIVDEKFGSPLAIEYSAQAKGSVNVFISRYGQQVDIPITATATGKDAATGADVIIGSGSGILRGELRGDLSDFPAINKRYTIELGEFDVRAFGEPTVGDEVLELGLANKSGSLFYVTSYTLSEDSGTTATTATATKAPTSTGYTVRLDDGTVLKNVTRDRITKIT